MSPETTVYLYCPHAKMTITTTSVSSVTSSLPNKSGYFRLSEANQKITLSFMFYERKSVTKCKNTRFL